jgi:hypothetical protein
MPGRHGRGIPDDRDPQAAIDMEATATARVIAGLRWRLRRLETLEHPKVRSELRKLIELIEEQSSDVNQNPGRHRSTAGKATSQQVNDASGFDLKPDPLEATTPAEFVRVLNEYKLWSGNPSWRMMARNASHMVVHSTMHNAMKSNALPNFDVMKAIVIGCGGGEEDLKAFATAWRRIAKLHSRVDDVTSAGSMPA